jgi:hypothetical protein
MAAACLSDSTCTGGLRTLNASLALARKFGYRPPLVVE